MIKKMSLICVAALLVAPAALAADIEPAPPAKAPSAMTPTEIKAFNDGLPATHPYYIKCRKTLEIGSLVKKNRVCRTNEQWKVANEKGNQDARDTAEAMTSKAGSGSN